MQKETAKNRILMGSYTDGQKKPSIYLYDPREQTATSILSTINPSFILNTQTTIHFVSESKKGQIITLDRHFNPIFATETNGEDPCHISADDQLRFIVVTNYTSGSFIAFLLDQRGVPSKGKFFIQHQGKSQDPDRQASPHPHSSVFSPDGDILFVADLGTDILYYYDISTKSIQINKERSVKIPKAGPRTVCRGKKGDKTLLLSCQLDNTIRIMGYDEGPLNCLAAYRVSTNIQNFLSEVYYFNDEVYLAGRGDDYILVFDYKKDALAEKFRFKVGVWPRHFALDGKYLYVACQKEGKVYQYSREGDKIMQLSILNIAQCCCISVLNEPI